MRALKRPILVDVEGPLTLSKVVVTPHGWIQAEPGDYVLTDSFTGDTWPIKAHIFAETYDVVEDDAK